MVDHKNHNREIMEYDLCEELWEEIFLRLPIDTLVKCKYVSKYWNQLVCRRKPSFGLIGGLLHACPRKQENQEIFILRSEKDKGGGECMMKPLKLFSLHRRLLTVLDSCNGLILSYIYEETPQYNGMSKVSYFVCNPILNQWVALPQPHHRSMTFKDMWHADIGLAFDGIQGHHYKVIRFFLKEIIPADPTATTANIHECEIFSSETGHWRQCQPKVFNIPSTLRRSMDSSRKCRIDQICVYLKGAIHWKIRSNRYMLVFYLEKEIFELIELPGDTKCEAYRMCLWESEGYLHYCNIVDDRFHIWIYTGNDGDDDDKNNDEHEQKWVSKHIIMIHTLLSQTIPLNFTGKYGFGSVRGHDSIDPLFILPVAFNSDLDVVYLRIVGVLFSYSFKTRRVELAWPLLYDHFSMDKWLYTMIRSFMFNVLDLPTWDGCEVRHPSFSSNESGLHRFFGHAASLESHSSGV